MTFLGVAFSGEVIGLEAYHERRARQQAEYRDIRGKGSTLKRDRKRSLNRERILTH
jgi:hypothetical protein